MRLCNLAAIAVLLSLVGCAGSERMEKPEPAERSVRRSLSLERDQAVRDFVNSLTEEQIRKANEQYLNVPPEQWQMTPDKGLPFPDLSGHQQELLRRLWDSGKQARASVPGRRQSLADSPQADQEPWEKAAVFNVGYILDPEGIGYKFALEFTLLRGGISGVQAAFFETPELGAALKAAGIDFYSRGVASLHPRTPEQKARREAMLDRIRTGAPHPQMPQ